jgi:beta-carotene hydroxylase
MVRSPITLRFSADWRTLLWAFVLFPGVAAAHYLFPELHGWLVPLGLYTGFCAGVLAHNQNHCPTFVGRRANALYAIWLSIFYGYPIFAWIPTHNRNHHRLMNRPGDATITWRRSKRNTWLTASTYFFVSAYWQKGITDAFLRETREANPRLYRQIRVQVAAFVGAHTAFLALALGLHGLARGSLVYLCGFGVPMAMGLWGMIFINYIQHVHCDPWSKRNHSRNFTGPIGNFLVFNAGLHTAHHDHPGAHWSTLPALHAPIAAEIDPALCQRSILGFCVQSYLLGIFNRRFRTRQIGRPAYDVPTPAGASATP